MHALWPSPFHWALRTTQNNLNPKDVVNLDEEDLICNMWEEVVKVNVDFMMMRCKMVS